MTGPSPYLLLLGLAWGTVAAEIIQFDEFELDFGRHELRRGGDRVVKLEKSPMELLILLVENQGQLVTREDIIQRLWGDNVFVDTRHGINTGRCACCCQRQAERRVRTKEL